MKNPFVFLVGCSRSGTTLLQKVVDSHPQIAIIPETRWFVRWYEKRTCLTPDGYVTSGLVPTLLRKHRLFSDVDLGIDPKEFEAVVGSGHELPYAKFVATVFDRYGHARGKPLVGNKTPGYVRRLSTLHRLWPRAKVVHIIRDGRDVCLSATERWKDRPDFRRFATWQKDPISTAAVWWEWNVRLGREGGKALGPKHYYEIRYEALVSRARDECEQLCKFLGVPYDGAMLRHQERVRVQQRKCGGIKHGRLRLPITAGLRDWRSQMTPENLEKFEAAAGGLLEELAYPVGAAGVRSEALEQAAKVRRVVERRCRVVELRQSDPSALKSADSLEGLS